MLEPPHRELLLHASRSDCLNVAAEADNCRFDEWAGGERWRRFEALVKDETSGVANWDDWRRAYNLHLGRSFHVPQRSVPDAFLDLNQGAWLTLPADRSLLRVENLSVALETNGYDFNGLKDLLRRADEGEADAIQEMHMFFNAWNQRPMLGRRLPRFGTKYRRSSTTAIGTMHFATAWGLGTTIPRTVNPSPSH